MNIPQLLEQAQRAAQEAGKAIMEVYRAGSFGATVKSDQSPLTIADQQAHSIIHAYLDQTALPILSEEGSAFSFAERSAWEYFWLVDPLDGTKEFLNRNGEFTVNIALIHQQRPVAGVIYVPATEIIFTGCHEAGAARIQGAETTEIPGSVGRKQLDDLLQQEQVIIVASRSHNSPETTQFINRFSNVTLRSVGSSLKFMLLLQGEADIYPRMGPTMEWDTAAAHAILNAANRGVYHTDLQSELVYNKKDLKNPFFIAI
jgi:3'(2'), 5'-bisphosphate nucleotidase